MHLLRKLFLIGLIIQAVWSRHVNFFRKDYKYIPEYDAFYKLHFDLNGVSWSSAFVSCDDEGARLFYPKGKEEWKVAANLSKIKDLPSTKRDIFIGYHNEYELGEFITIDGTPTQSPILKQEPSTNTILKDQCITMNIDTGEFNIDKCERNTDSTLPFICKKVDEESCPTIDSGYKYMKGSRKCYKINNRRTMWQDAMQTCFIEGGTLAIIENKADKQSVTSLMNSNEEYFVGFNRLFAHGDLYTVKGEKLAENTEIAWLTSDSADAGACGVLSYTNYNDLLRISTTDCGNRNPFICQMDVN